MDARVSGVLAPISNEDPCGADLSFSPEFDRIQEARRADDPTVDYGEWQVALKQAEWPTVTASCADLLQTRSKDLRLASWLAEAEVKVRGLSGLCDGIEIISCLIQRFGSEVHPRGENGDHERRISTLSWFVMRMAQLVRQIPVTQSQAGRYCLNDHESAVLQQTHSQRSGEPGGGVDEKITIERFAAAAAKTDKILYLQWIKEAEQCRELMTDLMKASDDLFGAEGPSFSPLDDSLDALTQRLRMIMKDLGIASVQIGGASEMSDQGAAHDAGASATVTPAGSIRTRAQALDLLRQVAHFFRNSEPHSPVAYLADKAAYWGEMPLHSWLRSVVKDQGSLSHIEDLLGLRSDLEQDNATN